MNSLSLSSEVSETVNSQGFYLGKCDTKIKQSAELALAYLSNTANPVNADISIQLNPICLSWCDFLTLFYSSNGSFYINPANRTACAVTFTNQTYETTQSKCIKLNLTDQIRKTWSSKNNRLISNIPIETNIQLNKESFFVKSLSSANYLVGLSLDQVFSTLLANGEIEVADAKSSATVQFVVSYKYCFAPLDVCVLVNFVYITKIPCYKNVTECDTFCPVYSYCKDTTCRTCVDLSGEETVISLLSGFKADKHFDTDSEVSSAHGDVCTVDKKDGDASLVSSTW